MKLNRRGLLQGVLATAALAWAPMRAFEPATQHLEYTFTLDEFDADNMNLFLNGHASSYDDKLVDVTMSVC